MLHRQRASLSKSYQTTRCVAIHFYIQTTGIESIDSGLLCARQLAGKHHILVFIARLEVMLDNLLA